MVDAVLDLHRLAVLHDLEILDTPPEVAYDEIAALASDATGSAIAAVNFVDGDRHWTKAAVGVGPGHDPTASSEVSLCAATVRSRGDLLCIPDATASPEWRDHPLVTGPTGLRFYAGATVVVSRQPVGVVCIWGDEPRALSRRDERSLVALARQVASQLELRRRDLRLRVPGLTDPLTGVANRRLLVDRLESAIAERRRRGDEVGVVLCRVGDASHERAGLADRLLTSVAQGLVHAVAPGDTVARSSPDEFTVVLPGLTGREDLARRVDRLRVGLPGGDRHGPGHHAGPGLSATLVRDGEAASSTLARVAAAAGGRHDAARPI